MLASTPFCSAMRAMSGVPVAAAPLKMTRTKRSPDSPTTRVSAPPSGNTSLRAASDFGCEKTSATSPCSTTAPSSRMATCLQMLSTTLI